jgi:protein DPCD
MQKLSDKPAVTSLIVSGKRRLVYAYPDGKEMIEEYDMKTHEILTRKIKKQSTFKENKWEYEIGEVEDKGSP